jgi:hypothetical protein
LFEERLGNDKTYSLGMVVSSAKVSQKSFKIEDVSLPHPFCVAVIIAVFMAPIDEPSKILNFMPRLYSLVNSSFTSYKRASTLEYKDILKGKINN